MQDLMPSLADKEKDKRFKIYAKSIGDCFPYAYMCYISLIKKPPTFQADGLCEIPHYYYNTFSSAFSASFLKNVLCFLLG